MTTKIEGILQNPDLLKDHLRIISRGTNELIKIANRGYRELPSKTITGTSTADDTATVFLADASTGNVIFTLASASSVPQRLLWIKRIDNSANSVTIQGQVDGSTSTLLASQYTSLTLTAISTQWWII